MRQVMPSRFTFTLHDCCIQTHPFGRVYKLNTLIFFKCVHKNCGTMVENYVYTIMLTICNCIYELLAKGSTSISWPDHLFACRQINTAGHSFTATSPQHTRTTAAQLFVQSACCLFGRRLTFYFSAVCTFERKDRRRKREAGRRPPVRGD